MATAATLNFQVDTSNYMGFQYEEYLNELQALAMSQPSKYYEMRKSVLKLLKQKVVSDVYKEYYGLLTTGNVGNGNPILDTLKISPNFPNQEASKFALESAKTINQILDKCLDLILPNNHLDVAQLRIRRKHAGDNIDVQSSTA